MQLCNQVMFSSMPLSPDASTYAHFLFNAFDTDHNGSVSFEVRFEWPSWRTTSNPQRMCTILSYHRIMLKLCISFTFLLEHPSSVEANLYSTVFNIHKWVFPIWFNHDLQHTWWKRFKWTLEADWQPWYVCLLGCTGTETSSLFVGLSLRFWQLWN